MTDPAKLLSEAETSFDAGNMGETIKAAKEALETYRTQGEGVSIAEALSLFLKGQLQVGEVTLDKAMETIKDDTMKLRSVGRRMGEAAMSQATAEVYLAACDPDKALQAAVDAEAGFEREGNELKQCTSIYKALVSAYLENSNEEKALTAATKGLGMAQKLADKKAEAHSFYAVAKARYAGGDVNDAMEACTKALSLFKTLGDKANEAVMSCFIAQIYLAINDSQGALTAAKDALSVAKDISSGVRMGEAVEMLVESHIQNESPKEAMTVAEEELAALEKSGKTAGVSTMMSAVLIATTALKGVSEGFLKVQEFVRKCRDSGNQRGEVSMLYRMACMAEYEDVAMNTAQAALKLAQQFGYTDLEMTIKDRLTELWVAKGQLNRAPTRKRALALLNELARNLEKRDVEGFQDTNKKLIKHMSALTQMDYEATIYKVISKSPEASMDFLKEHGLVADEVKKEGPVTGHKFRHVPVPNLYMGFRIGGLGYGPRYRVCCSNRILHEPGAMGVVELQDCSDDWERELGYSPSLLDGCLQTGAAMGH
mmetsp:Transcript_35798/g.83256  ORF Transcript_35798/g.83256 Transcript_35798/m.83256 type:complete len:541 (-) Transcript_35798:227-1849(-)